MEIAFLILRFLMATALYAFLGWALWLLWSRLRQQALKPGASPVPPLTLTLQGVEQDPGRGVPGESRSFRTLRPEVIIGRQPGSDLRLEESTISARHARLSFHHGQWWAEDLHSKNGTYLNDVRLSAPLVLASGDILRCGGLSLGVDIAPLAPAPAEEGV